MPEITLKQELAGDELLELVRGGGKVEVEKTSNLQQLKKWSRLWLQVLIAYSPHEESDLTRKEVLLREGNVDEDDFEKKYSRWRKDAEDWTMVTAEDYERIGSEYNHGMRQIGYLDQTLPYTRDQTRLLLPTEIQEAIALLEGNHKKRSKKGNGEADSDMS